MSNNYSHCHLDMLAEGSPEAAAPFLDNARAHGVTGFLSVCVELDRFEPVRSVAAAHPDVWCSVGVHPCQTVSSEPTAEQLSALAQDPNVVAIGETGLDNHYPGMGPDVQRSRFAAHIEAAVGTSLPVIVHTREAKAQTIQQLKDGGTALRGVIHCFTEDMDAARQFLDLGFYLSFSGIVSFRNADALRAVAAYCPLDRLLIETDAPYLAPVPHRGKTNEPAYVIHVAEVVAAVKGIGVGEVARASSDNFYQLFDRAGAVPH